MHAVGEERGDKFTLEGLARMARDRPMISSIVGRCSFDDQPPCQRVTVDVPSGS
jgi:hypothetical protein